MYKVSVPVTLDNIMLYGAENVYNQLKRFDPDRVFISIGFYETDPVKRAEVFCQLKKTVSFFKNKGLETGVWVWAFMMHNSPYTCMTSLKGQKHPENMCPTDEYFLLFAEEYAKDMARSGADIIMYDDDLRYGFLGDSPACVCENHLKKISEIVGEDVSAEFIKDKVYNGSKNKYRDAYLKANGDAFRNFAARMRKAVDSVDKSIRMGACACLNSWDIDGVSAPELSRIFSGEAKPFFRLIGAPYWGALKCWGISLQDSIELSRMECAWNNDTDIEIFSEGDAYPRPRTNVPASYLEGFDSALRAAGCTDGILKYGMDYTSCPDYETGYSAYHIRNRELYKKISKHFDNKDSIGVRVYETPAKLSDADFIEEENIDNLFFSLCARTLAYNTIPTVYEGKGITGAAFGENARHLTEDAFGKGLILDIRAAEILKEKGIDTGVKSFGEKTVSGTFEIFTDNNNRIAANAANIRDITVEDTAEILSYTEKDGRKIPMSFRYENSKGQRFFVLNIIPDINNPNILRHYERNRQYIENTLWLSGESLPAVTSGHPALYMQCKEKNGSLTVGLWNFFPDIVFTPEIRLSKNYTDIEFINCEGRLEENRVILSDIPAFGFAGFEVKE